MYMCEAATRGGNDAQIQRQSPTDTTPDVARYRLNQQPRGSASLLAAPADNHQQIARQMWASDRVAQGDRVGQRGGGEERTQQPAARCIKCTCRVYELVRAAWRACMQAAHTAWCAAIKSAKTNEKRVANRGRACAGQRGAWAVFHPPVSPVLPACMDPARLLTTGWPRRPLRLAFILRTSCTPLKLLPTPSQESHQTPPAATPIFTRSFSPDSPIHRPAGSSVTHWPIAPCHTAPPPIQNIACTRPKTGPSSRGSAVQICGLFSSSCENPPLKPRARLHHRTSLHKVPACSCVCCPCNASQRRFPLTRTRVGSPPAVSVDAHRHRACAVRRAN